MTRFIRPLTALLAIALFAGCQGDGEVAPPGASVAAPTNRAAPPAVDDPCLLLTDDEVRAVVAEAGPGVRITAEDEYGISSCWRETPAGRFTVQLYDANPGSLVTEMGGLALGLVDPRDPRAGSFLRVEKLDGIGDQALALAEKTDPGRNIVSGNAILAVQKGSRVVVVLAPDLVANHDRAAGLSLLRRLAEQLDGRL